MKRDGTAVPVGALANLGPSTSAWLAAIGVHTREDLAGLGVIPVYRAIRALGYPMSVVGAYALRAALLGCPWQALLDEERVVLRAAFAGAVRTAKPRSTRVAVRRRTGR